MQPVSGTAAITVGPGPVSVDQPLDEQVAYLRERVDQLAHTASIERDRRRQAVNNTNKTLGARIDEVSNRLEHTDEEVGTVRKATIGADGRALAETFGGLALTAMGVALTIVGLPGMPWSIPSG